MENAKSIGGEVFDEVDNIIDAEAINWTYSRINEAGAPDSSGDYILFGSYPAGRVSDTALIESLNRLAGSLPREGRNGSWVSYKYFEGKSKDTFLKNERKGSARNRRDFMWYRDIEHDGDVYRGVYFSRYRPFETTLVGSEGNSYQAANGYFAGVVYWFLFEPLIWKILDSTGSEAWLMSERIIDAQPYQNCLNYDADYYITDNEGRYITVDGGRIYANNYEHSSLRHWLNADFYNTAFTDTDKESIVRRRIDNSLKQGASTDNKFACADTEDFISTLSYSEAMSAGLRHGRLDISDYAKCQGLLADADRCFWILRSPRGRTSLGVCGLTAELDLSGYDLADNVCAGVRPTIHLAL